jgi:hypothetical protein
MQRIDLTKSCGCWQKDVARINLGGLKFVDAIEMFGEHMELPSEVLVRLKEEANALQRIT